LEYFFFDGGDRERDADLEDADEYDGDLLRLFLRRPFDLLSRESPDFFCDGGDGERLGLRLRPPEFERERRSESRRFLFGETETLRLLSLSSLGAFSILLSLISLGIDEDLSRRLSRLSLEDFRPRPRLDRDDLEKDPDDDDEEYERPLLLPLPRLLLLFFLLLPEL
jgi:hypothetical protein